MLFNIFKKKNNIYLDNAAGTAVDKKVFNLMKPYLSEYFFNPGALYNQAFFVREKILNARKKIAESLSVRYQDIIFTDGGTEANNLAIRGVISAWQQNNSNKKAHIVTSITEHSSILETCRDLESKEKITVTYLAVDEQGLINLKELKEAITAQTVLVSISYVNGEIGVTQDIKSIAKTIRHYRKHNQTLLPYFHSDAIQAVNYLDIHVPKLGVDLLTINASKIYGPKKIAALYKKTNITIDSIITGGNQEFGLRAGTENVPYIIGFAECINIAEKLKASEYARLNELQKFMESLLASKMTIPFLVNGLNSERIPNIVNISISNLSSEEIVIRLAAKGVLASVKSACKSGEDGDSHVIRALRDTNTQSIRFSMGRSTTRKDIEYTVKTLVLITQKMQETFLVYGK